MKTLSAIFVLAAAVVLTAQPVLAAAPQPRKPFDAARMPGRWYEIARVPNKVNRDCQGGYVEWTPKGPGQFRFSAICRKGSPEGKLSTVSGSIEIANPPVNNKVVMKLFGGVVRQEYWLLDHADDYSWQIMGTPGGNFISISSRGRVASQAVAAAALARARTLGYDTARLVMVRH
ncbi:MAG: lipocalin family protein [Caulobacteraceae bacterium]